MGKLHWLILVPYYFFGAITLLCLLVLVARILRLKVSINALVTASILVTIAAIVVPLVSGWVTIASLGGLGVAVLLATSFVFAAIDAILSRNLPLPLDEELTAED